MRSEARRLLDAVLSGAWQAALWLGGVPAGVRRWSSPGNQRVLVVAPHPDDELAGCGGTLVLHAAVGDEVTVLHVTDGRRSRALGLPPDEVASYRRDEARAALLALGVTRATWLGLPEGEWVDQDFAASLDRLLGTLHPHVIYAPSLVDFHPEHVRVARAAARSLAASGATMRVYQVQVPLTGVLANLVAPVGIARGALTEARACYDSQEAALRGPFRLKAYVARAHHLPGLAEAFWEMSARAYAVLHAGPVDASTSFRGLRRLPFTDPLAFTAGREERRRMRARIAAVRE